MPAQISSYNVFLTLLLPVRWRSNYSLLPSTSHSSASSVQWEDALVMTHPPRGRQGWSAPSRDRKKWGEGGSTSKLFWGVAVKMKIQRCWNSSTEIPGASPAKAAEEAGECWFSVLSWYLRCFCARSHAALQLLFESVHLSDWWLKKAASPSSSFHEAGLVLFIYFSRWTFQASFSCNAYRAVSLNFSCSASI